MMNITAPQLQLRIMRMTRAEWRNRACAQHWHLNTTRENAVLEEWRSAKDSLIKGKREKKEVTSSLFWPINMISNLLWATEPNPPELQLNRIESGALFQKRQTIITLKNVDLSHKESTKKARMSVKPSKDAQKLWKLWQEDAVTAEDTFWQEAPAWWTPHRTAASAWGEVGLRFGAVRLMGRSAAGRNLRKYWTTTWNLCENINCQAWRRKCDGMGLFC